MPSILIVDEHAVARLGLRRLLRKEFDGFRFGDAANLEAALRELVRRPWDLIILEIASSLHHGLTLLEELRAGYSHIPLLVVSIYPESKYKDHVIKLGASGYLCKTASRADLVKAVRASLIGKKTDFEATAPPPPAELSARERNVLQAIATGKRTGEIAAELNLSPKTVSTYRRRILDKLSLNSTADLVAYALDHNTRAPG